MTFETLRTDLEDGILTITINRPDKLNALNTQFFAELQNVMNDVYLNAEIRGVIITGMGNKAFAAGADVAEFAAYNSEQGKHLSRTGHEVLNSIERCPKPVIAAVNGFALGGGCELAMACHLRYASENAVFGQPEVNLGVTPGYAGTQRLVQLIGKGRAMEMLITTRSIKADEAERLGLVNGVVSADALHSHCYEVLDRLKGKSPEAIAATIRCVNAYFDEGVDGFEFEIDTFGACFDTEDFTEGTTAFLEKRKPSFKQK